ncbi:MAG: ABC transporter permease [Flexilinea sp.]
MRLLIALLIGLIISSIFILAVGENPIKAYSALISGAWSSRLNFFTTLRWTVPYIIAGIAAAVSFRAGLFNMGLEGCIYVGALVAALLGTIKGLSPIVHVPLCIGGAIISGMILMLVPAWLKAKYGTNEVIITWMISYASVLLCSYLVTEYFQKPEDIAQAAQQVRTPFIETSAALTPLLKPYKLNTSFYIAIILVIAFFVFTKFTRYGYEHRMMGLSYNFAVYGGVKTKSIQFWSLLISGGIAAIVGAAESLGINGQYIHGFSTSMGPNGIMVALMGRLNPIGVTLSSLFMGAIQSGARVMVRATDVSVYTMNIMISIIVICITADGLFELLRIKKKQRQGD